MTFHLTFKSLLVLEQGNDTSMINILFLFCLMTQKSNVSCFYFIITEI